MSISTLANTKWIFNETPNISATKEYSITFTANNESFIKLNIFYGGDNKITYRYSNDTGSLLAYSEDGEEHWFNGYRTIKITGGNDVTNANLIAWFEANAVQIVPKKVLKINNKIVSMINNKYISTFNGKDIMSGIVPAVSSFNNVNITLYAYYSSVAKYQVNEGSWVSVNKNSSTHNYIENNVEKLIIDGDNLDTSEVSWYIKDANNTTVASGSGYDLPLDVTQYLSDGCSVVLYTY